MAIINTTSTGGSDWLHRPRMPGESLPAPYSRDRHCFVCRRPVDGPASELICPPSSILLHVGCPPKLVDNALGDFYAANQRIGATFVPNSPGYDDRRNGHGGQPNQWGLAE